MRKEELQRELNRANEALDRGMITRLGYEFLIEELIKGHPNPKATFNDIIKTYPLFKELITDLADLLKFDLCIDE